METQIHQESLSAEVVEYPSDAVQEILFVEVVYHQGFEVPSLPVEIAAGVETADSEVGIGDFEIEIEDFVAAVGYPDIQIAWGIESPAGPDPIVQPWW